MSAQHGSWILGNVTFDFSVGVDGQVTNINVLGGISNCLYVELYELLSKMPKWSPTLKNGSPVLFTYSMNIPLRFIMKKNEVLDPLPKKVLIER